MDLIGLETRPVRTLARPHRSSPDMPEHADAIEAGISIVSRRFYESHRSGYLILYGAILVEYEEVSSCQGRAPAKRLTFAVQALPPPPLTDVMFPGSYL
jgi:hypothetical protein